MPFPAGGIADVHARHGGRRVGETWGQPAVVENRTGTVAKSAPDSYALIVSRGLNLWEG